MAVIIEHDGKQYLVTVSKPETDWITLCAAAMGMSKETVIGAALNKGLCHYVEMLAEITKSNGVETPAEDTPTEPNSEAKERKTYNKGSCQG